MAEVILLEIISVISFIYSILLLIVPFASINHIFIIFIWTNIISAIFAINYRKGRLQKISIVLLLVPLIFYNDLLAKYFIIISSILIFAYIKTSLLKADYLEYGDVLKRTYLTYILVITLGLIYNGYNRVLNYMVPFIIIYLLSSTILVRTIRHLGSGMNIKDIRSVNRKYIGVISVVSSIMTLDNFRNLIFTILNKTYLLIIYIIFKILYYPIVIILGILGKIGSFILSKLIQKEINYEIGMERAEEFEDVKIVIRQFPIIDMVFKIGIIILLIYILYKIIKRSKKRNYITEEYIEEREFIKRTKGKGRRKRDTYPKEFREQIRYFYRRYLERLKKEDLDILDSDTSLEISKKTPDIFSRETNDEIRNIYIKSRYSSKEIDEKEVEEIKRLYDEI